MSQQTQGHGNLNMEPSRSETMVGIGAAVLTLAMFGGLMFLFT
jgi:hypothetical protein